MTGKADFTPEEWKTVLEGPPSAGLIVITAQRGGTFRETISMAKAYTEARQEHGSSELLDEIVSTKPQVDHTRYHSPEDSKNMGFRTFAKRSRCSTARRARRRSRSTDASSSRWRRRSPTPTARAAATP